MMNSRPIPVIDTASEPFFTGAKQGKLMLRYCRPCERYLAYDRDVCDRCFNHVLEWRAASGKGTIYSFILQHQVTHPGFAGEVPFTITVVELEEGPRLRNNIVGPLDRLAIGARVEVVFQHLSDEVTVPKFRIATEPT
jgi:uncharacterized OB-fold protein